MTKNIRIFFSFTVTIFFINFIVSLFFLFNEKLNIKFFKFYEVIKIKEKTFSPGRSFLDLFIEIVYGQPFELAI